MVDDLVLVLLPSSTNKLLAKWQGPFPITEVLSHTTYHVSMTGTRKLSRTFHVNMLARWESPSAVCNCLHSSAVDAEGRDYEDIPTWPATPVIAPPKVNPELLPTQTEELRQLLATHEQVFTDQPGLTTLTSISIDTGESTPISSPPYIAYLRLGCRLLLRAGLIEVSRSPWASPIVLVPKKNRSLRLCVDYRKLNAVTHPDPFPMPRVEDRLAGAKYITTLDLTKGYWQVPVEEGSREKTAFTTPFGKYQFSVMPFGLVEAPATFQRLMNSLVGDLSSHVGDYIDDLVIFSKTWEDHLTQLHEVLCRLGGANLTVKKSKCQFAMYNCLYLGHRVGHGQVQPASAKIHAIQNFIHPRTKKDIRSFLGLAGGSYPTTPTSPPHYLTSRAKTSLRRSTGLISTSRHSSSSSSHSADPVLQGPDYMRPFILQTDASDVGIAAVLSQKSDEDGDRPVAFYSRKLCSRERNYAAVERECLAIVDGVRHFEVYLTGVTFTIVTDHSCLRYLHNMKDVGGRLTYVSNRFPTPSRSRQWQRRWSVPSGLDL